MTRNTIKAAFYICFGKFAGKELINHLHNNQSARINTQIITPDQINLIRNMRRNPTLNLSVWKTV